MKYALSGRQTAASEAIAAMPAIWRDCLEGHGELDLRSVRMLSDHQYLWSTGDLASRIAGFFAGKLVRGRIRPVTGAERPPVLRGADFRGAVYRLDEPVLDVGSLVRALVRLGAGTAHLLPTDSALEPCPGGMPRLRLSAPQGAVLEVRARRWVLAAGAGNAGLLDALGHSGPAMQLRPLHMGMLRGALPALYAHCLGPGSNPRLTITSHPSAPGQRVWYLGGEIAERGVARRPEQQIVALRAEVQAVLPWLELGGAAWSSVRVERAEPAQGGGGRPDNCFVEEQDGVLVVWPTKLAFAPRVAALVAERLGRADVRPSAQGAQALQALPQPPFAPMPWEAATSWS